MSAQTPSPLPSRPAPKVAVVIPARNEAATIRAIAERALAFCEDVIVVDDGSVDGTAKALANLPVTLIQHPKFLGKGAALALGFSAALERDVSAVATMDADGQHRPENLTAFADHFSRRPGTIIVGSRMSEPENFPKMRYWGNRIAAFWLSWACGQLVEDSQCGFRMFPRKALERVSAKTGPGRGFVYESELLINASRAGYRISSVPIPAIYSAGARPSYYRPWRDTLGIIGMVAGKLLARGMYPSGLVSHLNETRARKSDRQSAVRAQKETF
jgi:glycosyltransferase involved in cell wall biosynthesis